MKSIKILAVDDEPMVLRYLRQMILDLGLDIHLDTAANGEKALARMAEAKPDILITDIRMPYMDGMTLIDHVISLYDRQIICVVMSAYSDFEYMRKAINLYVTDYLLKPVNIDDMRSLLNRLAGQVDKRRQNERATLLNKLVNGTAADICGQGECKFLIWMFCEGTMHRRGSGWYTVTDHPDTHLVATVQTALVPQGYDIMFFTGKWINEEIVLVNTEGLSEDRVQHAEQVLARLLTAHHHPVTVLTAIVADDLPAIQRLLARMRTDMEKCLMFCRSSIFKYGEPRSAGSALACLFEDQIMNDLPSAIKARNVNGISEIFKNMLEQLECKGIAQAQVGLLMQSLAVLLKNAGLIAADDLGALASELQDMMDGCESFAEFHTALHAFISSLIPASENEQHQQISRNRSICDQVEQYILNNYAKPLSIREIASLNFIAGGYLSALYKKHKGISLIEFITSVRMAKAQEIMEKQPDILLKEVAQMVGYNDPLYFSRIFKKTIGQSPSRFLKEHSLFD